MNGPTDSQAARDELAFIKDLAARTERRIDPHAFHFVHWGVIVLLWYPIANQLALMGRTTAMLWLGVGAMVLGMTLSAVREARLGKTRRLEGENTFVGKQVGWIAFLCVGGGIVLSAFGPATKFVAGPEVPVIWGLVYANLAAMIGVVYRREFLFSGLVIFVAALVAMIFKDYNGFILGPVMGLGLIVPGVMAERRVKALREGARAD